MRGGIGFLLGVALFVAGCSGGGSGGAPPPIVPDAYEPNDTAGSCSGISLDFLETGLSLHDPADVDTFCFTLPDDSAIQVTASFVRALGEMEVDLLDDGGLLRATSLSQSDTEVISEVVLAGSYRVRVQSPTGEMNTYGLEIQAQVIVLDPPPDPREGAGDDAFCGPDIGDLLVAPYGRSDLTIHDSTDVDHFCLTLSATATVAMEVRFDHSLGNLDVELLDSSQGAVAWATSLDDDESLSVPLSPGTYSIRVFSPSGQTNRYAILVAAAPGPYPPDAFEPNGSPLLCTYLPMLPVTYTDLTIHSPTDEDWFCFTLPDIGRDWTLTADILFTHSIGDLDMDLWDDQVNLIQAAQSRDDNEQISATLPAGDYYLRIYGNGGAENLYDLNLIGL